MRITIAPRNAPTPAPPRPTGVMTPVITRGRETFTHPTSNPGGRTRREMWEAVSKDGQWRYVREDDEGTPWTIEFVPTGQRRYGVCSTLSAARKATAGGVLLGTLRGEAVARAFNRELAEQAREEAQRWLAVHMRLAGSTDVEAVCDCGGLLVVATSDSKYAHVDACYQCWGLFRNGEGGPCEHKFCGTPAPKVCGHDRDDQFGPCQILAQPNNGDQCGEGKAVDCCLSCCQSK